MNRAADIGDAVAQLNAANTRIAYALHCVAWAMTTQESLDAKRELAAARAAYAAARDPLLTIPSHCLLFGGAFAGAIDARQKNTTIRRAKRAHKRWSPGDILELRTWSARPYRSRQTIIAYAILDDVCEVRPKRDAIWTRPHLGDRVLLDYPHGDDYFADDDISAFAAREGFASHTDLLAYLRDAYGYTPEVPEPLLMLISWNIPQLPQLPQQPKTT
ncbi:MAG: hypothetical protein LBR07_05175 [Puniceicoccales bacterium]|nr:hypothetical protein [Puniceicoccales bacterium]